ncbi:MAG: META domain-containing protein [Actinomycetota bacterium]
MPTRRPLRHHLVALAVLAGVALFVAACGSDDVSTDAGAGDSDGDTPTAPEPSDAGSDAAAGGATRPWIAGDWVLQSATGPDGPLELPAGVVVDLSITGPDSVRGNAGCNSFGGAISAPFDGERDGGSLSFDGVAITEMGCEFLDFESAYVDLLFAATEWELSPPNGLVFRGDGVELVYGVGEPPAPVPLEETLWLFDTVFDGEGMERTASTPRLDKEGVSVVFRAGVALISSEDCGTVEVAVEYDPGVTGGPFVVVDPASATATCDDPESNLPVALAGVASSTGFQIVDGRLTLIGLPGETVSFAAADG